MIPKVIHYCWFGNGEKPKLIKKCIKSWKKYCPDFEIIEWNESNYDFSKSEYAKQAYDEKAWSFVTDFVRYDVIYNYGGIYLDTDVELIKDIDFLLTQKAFMGFENNESVASGLGFGAEKHNPIIGEILDYVNHLKYRDESGNLCRVTQPIFNTEILLKNGLRIPTDGTVQNLENITIYPIDYFCPKNHKTGECVITSNTVAIHHYDGSWLPPEFRKAKQDWWRKNRVDYILHAPQRLLSKLLGDGIYQKIKATIKKK